MNGFEDVATVLGEFDANEGRLTSGNAEIGVGIVIKLKNSTKFGC